MPAGPEVLGEPIVSTGHESVVEHPFAPSPGAMPSPFEVTAAVIRGRWAALILWSLFWGEKRFYQVLRDVVGISRKTLMYELQELERRGIVERRVQRLQPLEVFYTLTPSGQTLKLVLGAMYEWGLYATRRVPVLPFAERSRAPLYRRSRAERPATRT